MVETESFDCFVYPQQRGKVKEEEFAKKLQEITMVEEKMRIPIAQGLPWTTDEPEVRSSKL